MARAWIEMRDPDTDYSQKLMGRKSVYNVPLGQKVAYYYATQPRSLYTLCQDEEDFPDYTTIHAWKRDHPEFGELWERAKEVRAHMLMDDAMDIAEDVDPDHQFGSARVAKAKLQVSVRQRFASILNPVEFGTTGIKLSGGVGVSFKDLISSVDAELK